MDLDAFPDGIIVAGRDARVTFVNQRVKQMARALPDEMIGMHLDEALPFDDLNGNHWFDSTEPYSGLAIRKRISEQSWWSPRGSEYLISAALIRDRPAGDVREVIVSVRNARIRNRHDRERSDMIATLAHELRSPLTGIKGFTATLLSKWEKFSEEQRRFMLEAVDADADRLGRLITELLDASRIDAGRLTLRRGPVDIAMITRHALSGLTHMSRYDVDIDDDAGTVWGDADRVTQVVANLLDNAQLHGNGLRRIEVSRQYAEHGGGDPMRSDGVQICVYDNGAGIPVEDRQRVFSRFWKSGTGAGSGLGMYVVRGIVEEHGGYIEIQGQDPQSPAGNGQSAHSGAVICVWLPTNEPEGLTDEP